MDLGTGWRLSAIKRAISLDSILRAMKVLSSPGKRAVRSWGESEPKSFSKNARHASVACFRWCGFGAWSIKARYSSKKTSMALVALGDLA